MRIIILFLFLFVSCNKKEKTKELIQTTPIIENSFSEKLENEPKIFLKFWKGMNFKDYLRVADTLKKEGVLENEFSYKANSCEVKLDPNFVNDFLYSISLVENIECIYDLYVEKYKIPNMIEKSSILYYYRENNPNYSPKYFYEEGGLKKELPDCFRDKSNFVSEKVKLNTDLDWSYEKFLPKDSIIIDNENIMIRIRQEIGKSQINKFGRYSYSIEESQEYADYTSSKEGAETTDILSAFNGRSLSEYIKSNSKTRTNLGYKSRKITIEYLMKSDYEKEIKKLNDKIVKEKTNLKNKKDNEIKRKEQVKKEI